MKPANLIGHRFANLVVIGVAERHRNRPQWLCQCDCGGQIIKQQQILRRPTNHGCSECETSRRADGHTVHGGSRGGKSRLFNIWKGIRKRCLNPNTKRYSSYGGAGIFICSEWNDFAAFREWANLNGYSDDLSIDRIDNELGYNPENCRWADAKTQSCNRRTAKMVLIHGEKMNTSDAERLLGVSYGTVNSHRQRHGGEHQEIINFIIKKRG